MLSAYAATPIAYMGDGFIIHMDCVDDDKRAEAVAHRQETGVDRDFYHYLEDEYGLRVLSRYEIDSFNGETAYDIERSPSAYSVELADMIERKETLDRTLDIFEAVRDRLDPDGYDANGQHHTDIEDLDAGEALIEDMRDDLDSDIEDMIDMLAAVHCDRCMKVIE